MHHQVGEGMNPEPGAEPSASQLWVTCNAQHAKNLNPAGFEPHLGEVLAFPGSLPKQPHLANAWHIAIIWGGYLLWLGGHLLLVMAKALVGTTTLCEALVSYPTWLPQWLILANV